jgi:hypothetical protein
MQKHFSFHIEQRGIGTIWRHTLSALSQFISFINSNIRCILWINIPSLRYLELPSLLAKESGHGINFGNALPSCSWAMRKNINIVVLSN